MRILALQLKRIGDLVLTTPALRALRAAWPEAHLALGVSDGCASLLGAIEPIDSTMVFGRGCGWAPWQQVLTGEWDICLDFTGTDRSALATALSRAKDRRTFAWVRRRKLRSLAYHDDFVESSVRERHTVDHYLDLATAVIDRHRGPLPATDAMPHLHVSATVRNAAAELLRAHGICKPFAVLQPGTARAEKFWLTERWMELANHLRQRHGLDLVLTGGSDPMELEQVAALESAEKGAVANLAGKTDLLMLAAIVERAALVVSCDTGIVHITAAFQRPQVALYGPTNPFHWRPRHERALVISAAQPDAPLTDFHPRLKGAPMHLISTDAVIRATDALLARDPASFSSPAS